MQILQRAWIVLLILVIGLKLVAMNDSKDSNPFNDYPVIYLIPGQGADYRLFNNFELPPEYEIRHIHYHTPDEGLTMKEYAEQLAVQIDTNQKFILIGASLGGMLATEMNEFLDAEKVIIIASAKNRDELPFRYRFQKEIPIYKVVSSKMAKTGAQIMQPIVEYDRRKEKDTFVRMLKDKDPLFLKRTIAMIVNWERESGNKSESIIHIHGSNDKTIPIRNVDFDYKIDKGSHMMTLTRGKELSKLLCQILREG